MCVIIGVQKDEVNTMETKVIATKYDRIKVVDREGKSYFRISRETTNGKTRIWFVCDDYYFEKSDEHKWNRIAPTGEKFLKENSFICLDKDGLERLIEILEDRAWKCYFPAFGNNVSIYVERSIVWVKFGFACVYKDSSEYAWEPFQETEKEPLVWVLLTLEQVKELVETLKVWLGEMEGENEQEER